MCRSTGLLQRLALLLWHLCLPCALFGSGDAVVLTTRGTATRTAAASAGGDSMQLVLRDHHSSVAVVDPHESYVSVSGPEDNLNMTRQSIEEQRSQACVSNNVTLLHTGPLPAADLPCLTFDTNSTEPVAIDSGLRVAMFVLKDNNGAAKMRGELMAAAFKTFAGWDAVFVRRVVDKETGNHSYRPALPETLRVDICVVVKFPKYGLDACKAHNAKVIYWDILDSPVVPKLLLAPPNMSVIPSEIDILLTPDAEFSAIMNAHLAPRTTGYVAGLQRSIPLYHSHTNNFVVSPVSRFALPYVCRVAIFVSEIRHSPTREEQLRMQEAVCQSPNVWTFSILTQVQQGKDGPIVNSSLEDHVCKDRPQEMHNACLFADQLTMHQHEEFKRSEKNASEFLSANESGAQSCGAKQSRYHKDVHNLMVDVAIIAAESAEPTALHRPSTRVITWMSYGVPVMYTSGFAYDEIAEAWDYVLPGDFGLHPLYMSFPRSPWPPYLADHMDQLSNTSIRMNMREKGLAMAAQFTTQAVAGRLIAHFEKTLC